MDEKEELMMCSIFILQGICSADWKFDVKEKSWDEQATDRALDLSEILIKKINDRLSIS